MENPPNIQQAAELLNGFKRLIHSTYWSYNAQLERLKLFKNGHDEDTEKWLDRARSNPNDLKLQQLAESGSQGTGYLDLLLSELEDHSLKIASFMRFVDDLELQLRIRGVRA